MKRLGRLGAIVMVTLMASCSPEEPTAFDEAAAETGLDAALGALPEEARVASGGPRVAAGASTEVWSVTNAWADTNTAAAREAGVAWGANSGLSWEQKFERWVASVRKTPRTGGGSTIQVPTPYGERVLNAPTLECAEVALFLRISFSSWYHLPFFLQGWDSTSRQTLYAGHFGFVNRNGQNVGRFPLFRTAYRDLERSWRAGQTWPSDATLRKFRLGSDDAVSWLAPVNGAPAGAGAYFDEMFLNKRVGYFARLVLLYFGSVNLADPANMYHVQPEAIAPGDLLVERWQRQGIGHVIPVVRVTSPMAGRFAVDVISGSMPRRQPVWDDPASARRYFTLAYTGGEGEASDGTPYAALGGGLRRWRSAVLRSGQWQNEILAADQPVAIDDADHAAIAARPTRFGEILVVPSVAEQREAALNQIRSARAHLRMYPASCSARTRREDGFEELYRIEREASGRTQAQVDGQYRQLEDHVFAELEYTASRTCCWNSSTAAMAEIALDYAAAEQRQNASRGMCAAPTVFKAEGASTASDGYARWRAHAMTLGRAADWRQWSEDEPCMARGNTNDVATGREPEYVCR
ncbi:MAG: hypothetical protein JNK72_08370 [Myxococcales bacterium]|nr:hypothetical protein [Myxococcales bacterium]